MSRLNGSTIGEYRIDTLIGEGPTGRVYRATHTIRRHTVALKILHDATRGPAFKGRFFEVAQLVTSLTHPNIAKVDHYGEDQNTFYIVTELIPGGSLENRFSEPPSGHWNDEYWSAVESVAQAADGLAAVHSKGLTHGAIKPTNLLLARSQDGTVVTKLTDVGVAQLLSESAPTKDGPLLNAAYASPEQRQGLTADQRSDIYSLGALLYELIIRRSVFRAFATGGGGSGQATIAQPRQLMTNFPPELESAVMRCLAPDPNDRFATATDLSTALRTVLKKYDYPPTKAPLAVKVEVRPAQTTKKVFSLTQPPPPPPRMGGKNPAKVPCIQVLDSSGTNIETRFLAGGGAIIGSSPASHLVLNSSQVSAEHARLDWNGHNVIVRDLGSADGTLLDNHRLLPQVEQVWMPEKWLRIGPYFLWLETDLGDGPGPDPKIDVVLDQSGRNMTLIPGRQAVCRVTLVNSKAQVDAAFITLEGIPEQWVQGDNRDINLQPFERNVLELTIDVPRAPSSLAKDYQVRIKANSRAHPLEEQGFVVASWTVAVFDDMHVDVKPPKAGSRKRVRYNVTIHNKGNYETNCTVTAVEEEKELELKFLPDLKDQTAFKLKNGEKRTVKLLADVERRWVGSSATYPFDVRVVTGEGKPSETDDAEFVHKPVFPTWMLAIAPVLLIGIVFLALYWGKPEIPVISVSPRDPVAGKPIQIGWETPRATRVQVLVNDLAIPDLVPSDGKYTFPDGFDKDTRIKVIAGNIFGDAPAKEITVSVRRPPAAAPPVIEMTVNATEVIKGQSVTITWNITGATSADFNLRGTVGMQGSYTDKPEADQTYTITAVNADNVATKKSFAVTVKPIPVVLGSLRLSVSSPTARVGQTLVLTWQAPNAQAARIDAVNGTQLTGNTGQKTVTFKGAGLYEFTLVATDANNIDVRTKPIQVKVECPRRIPILQKCSRTPALQWQ